MITVTRAESCPEYNNSIVKYENTLLSEPEKSKFYFSADVQVLQNIQGQIEAHIESSRCNIDRSNCQNHDKVTIKDFCSILHDQSAPWTPLIDKVIPRPNCPIKQGIYKVTNGSFDTSFLSPLPIHGYRWVIKAILLAIDDQNNISQLSCFDVELVINVGRNKRKGIFKYGRSKQ